MADLVQTDYTEESWNALQERIKKAENAATIEEYDAAKAELDIGILVPAVFEKTELDRVLRLLIGKLERDYTSDSWKELIDAIDAADSAKLKSEYDAIKNKLTVNNLILEEEKSFFEDLLSRMQEDPLILGMVICIGVLFLILIITMIVCIHNGRKRRKDEFDFGREMPRRMK